MTKSAKLRELDMIAEKDSLENYKDALLRKEQEALEKDREV